MNEPTIRLDVRTEVSAFVDQVRARLADLSDEDREELVGGLEADIAELVSDGGSVAELGDPRAYADELRAAAGIERSRGGGDAPDSRRARRVRRAAGERVGATLDGLRHRWLDLVDSAGLDSAWQVAVALRPVWWVARAWAAVQLFDAFLGNGRFGLDVLPSFGTPLFGKLLLVAAVVVSVQIGRGKLWPGRQRQTAPWSRLLLLGLNTLAVLVVTVVVPQLPTQRDIDLAFDRGYRATSGAGTASGLMQRGRAVENVFPYDVQGQPLTGVQLFDQDGRPLNVAPGAGDQWSESGDRVTVTYPWFNGTRRLYNVFPLPRRAQTEDSTTGVQVSAWSSANPPALPTPPLAVVPPAALPTAQPAADETTGAGPTTGADAKASGEGADKGAAGSDSENPAGR